MHDTVETSGLFSAYSSEMAITQVAQVQKVAEVAKKCG